MVKYMKNQDTGKRLRMEEMPYLVKHYAGQFCATDSKGGCVSIETTPEVAVRKAKLSGLENPVLFHIPRTSSHHIFATA